MEIEVGFDEGKLAALQDEFARYPIVAAEATGKGLGSSARVVAKNLRQTRRFRDHTKNLRKSIRVSGVPARAADAQGNWRTIVRGASQVRVTAPHAHLTEFGREPGVADSGRKYPGSPALHWISQGTEESAVAALKRGEEVASSRFLKQIKEIR